MNVGQHNGGLSGLVSRLGRPGARPENGNGSVVVEPRPAAAVGDEPVHSSKTLAQFLSLVFARPKAELVDLGPVITAVLASFMLRERITLLRIGCLLVGLAGVFLLSVEDLKQSSFLRASYLSGNLLILAGCLGSSFYNVYCKGLLQRYQEIEILIFSYLTASVASLPLLLWVEPFQFSQLAALDWKGWSSFAFLAVFMYGLSMVLFFYVLQHLPVTVASASLYLVPVFGILLAAGFLHELLAQQGPYRRLWERDVVRSRPGEITQLAVAQVLARYLWSHPRAAGDADALPRQLKDTVARALSARHT